MPQVRRLSILTVYDTLNRPFLRVQNWDGVTSFTQASDCDFTTPHRVDNLCTLTTYDSLGRQHGVTDPSGRLTEFAYDSLGRVTTSTTYLEGTPVQSITTYDALGNRLTQTNAEGHTTTFTYDTLNRLVSTQSPEGVVVTQQYDAGSRVIATTNALGHTHHTTYDGVGRVISTTSPMSHTTTYVYDLAGNQVAQIDAEGVQTGYQYDGLNRLVAVIENEDETLSTTTTISNVTTLYTYDALGNQLGITNALGYSHTTTLYDTLNRPVSVTNALGHETLTSYNALNQRTILTDANGAVTTYTYDALNRLATVDYVDDGELMLYGYDVRGNRTVMTDGIGTTSYTYDDLNRLTLVNDVFSKTVQYQYDLVGNRTRITYPDGKVVRYTYDGDNRLVRVQDWQGGHTRYGYDVAGRLISTTLPNGVQTLYIYDADNRLTNLRHEDRYGTQIAHFAYELDSVGNRVVATETMLIPAMMPASSLTGGMTSDEVLASVLDSFDKPVTEAKRLPASSATPSYLPYTSILNLQPVTRLEIILEKTTLIANGKDVIPFTIRVTNRMGQPVRDKTVVHLRAVGVTLSDRVLRTVDGEAHGTLTAGRVAGVTHLSARVGTVHHQATLTLHSEGHSAGTRLDETPLPALDGRAVAERGRNQIERPIGQPPQLTRPTHHARFGTQGLLFTTTPTDPIALTVRFHGLRSGNRSLVSALTHRNPVVWDNVVRFEHGRGVMEEFVATDAGIEQRWWLETAPRLYRGDVYLTVAIETPLLPHTTPNGVAFRNAQGETKATYGRAIAISADGRTLHGDLSWTQTAKTTYHLTFHFPAEWMAKATYPLLIDPLIGHASNLGASEEDQTQPAVAYKSTDDTYLIVWEDDRLGTNDLYGQLVASDGTVVPSTNNVHLTAGITGTHRAPAIAYSSDADQYLLLWTNQTTVTWQLVTADGVMTGTHQTIEGTASDVAVTYSPAAEAWLMTWTAAESGAYRLRAQAVYSSGVAAAPYTVYQTAGQDSQAPAITADTTGRFLIAWSQTVTPSNHEIYAQWVLPTAVTGTVITSALSGLQATPAVAYHATTDEVMVVWQTTGITDTIEGRRLDASTNAWLGTAPTLLSDQQASDPHLIVQGDGTYRVLYSEGILDKDLWARTLSSTGTLMGTPLAVHVGTGGDQDAVAIAGTATGLLAVWEDTRGGTPDIYGTYVPITGDPLAEFRPHPTPGDQKKPQAAYHEGADEYLVVWSTYQSATLRTVEGRRVTKHGEPLGDPLVFDTGAFVDEVYVAYGNGRYLVVWTTQDDVLTSRYDLMGQWLDEEGQFLGTSFVLVDNENESLAGTDALYRLTTDDMLVLLTRRPSGGERNIWGLSLPIDATTGTLFQLSTQDTLYEGQAVGAYDPNAQDTLVVWVQGIAQANLLGRIVSADNDVATSTITLTATITKEWLPDIAYLPKEDAYLVVWQREISPSTSSYDMMGQSVGTDGTVGTPFSISDHPKNEGHAQVVANADGTALVVWEQWQGANSTQYDLIGRRIDSVPIDDSFPILTITSDQIHPNLAGDGRHRYLLVWKDTRSHEQEVYAQAFAPLHARFAPHIAAPDEVVTFEDRSFPAGISDQWHWTLGNGLTSTLPSPTTSYTPTGIYTVTLTVTDIDSTETDTTIHPIQILDTQETIIHYTYDPLYQLTHADYTTPATSPPPTRTSMTKSGI